MTTEEEVQEHEAITPLIVLMDEDFESKFRFLRNRGIFSVIVPHIDFSDTGTSMRKTWDLLEGIKAPVILLATEEAALTALSLWEQMVYVEKAFSTPLCDKIMGMVLCAPLLSKIDKLPPGVGGGTKDDFEIADIHPRTKILQGNRDPVVWRSKAFSEAFGIDMHTTEDGELLRNSMEAMEELLYDVWSEHFEEGMVQA